MSDCYAWLATAPVFGLLFDCLAHISVSRGVPRLGPYYSLILAFFVGLLATVGVSLGATVHMGAPAGDVGAYLAMNAAAFFGLSYGYFGVVNLNLTSLRIRILKELLAAGGEVPRSQLLSRYDADNVSALRITRLTRGGYLVEREGRFYGGKGLFLLITRMLEFLRWIILGAASRRSSRPRGSRR